MIVLEQVAIIVEACSPDQEWLSGSTLGAVTLLAALIAPRAGVFSDRSRNPEGRRNLMIAGTIGSSLGFLLLASFGRSSSLALYGIGFLPMTFWWNRLPGD